MAKLKAKNPKKAKPRKPQVLIYGEAGVGKTWGAIEFPSVYYIDSEGGASLPHYTDKLAEAGGVYLGPEDGANDMEFVVGQIIALATCKHEYKTVVIDSFSKLYNTAIQIEYDKMKAAGRDMNTTFSAERKPAIALTRQMIRWLEKVDMNCIFICHEKVQWAQGAEVGRTFDAWDKLAYELDLTLRIQKLGKRRDARVCKSRIHSFEQGSRFAPWGYAEFAKLYGAETMEAPANYLEPSTTEQLSVLRSLLEKDGVTLSNDQKVKWFEKAGVTSWEQMDKVTLDACINYLTSKNGG